jgi:type I restriction enzyme S subunit
MKGSTVTFGELVRKVNDRVDPVEDGLTRFVAGEHMDTDDLVIRRYGNVGDGYLGPAFHMRFKHGHILYGSRRTYLRKVSMAHFDGVCSNTTFVLEPQNETLSSKYLLYLMSTERFHQNSIALSKGSTNPYINFSDLANFEFVLPSLEEQTRIVELLSAVDNHAEALRHQLNVAVETRKSVLQNLLGKGGEGWTKTTLGEVVNFSKERIDPLSLPPSSELCHWSIPALDETGGPVTERASQIGSHKFKVEKNSVIVSLLNPRIPRIAYVSGGKDVVCSTEFAVMQPHSGLIEEFLLVFVSSAKFHQTIEQYATGTTKSRERVKTNQLEGVELLLPPLDEQKQIVEEISKIDVLIEETSATLNSTKQLRTSLLNKEIA